MDGYCTCGYEDCREDCMITAERHYDAREARINASRAARKAENDLAACTRIMAYTGVDRFTAKAVWDCMGGQGHYAPPGYTITIVGNPGEELVRHEFVGEKGTYIEIF